ncbi:hypothetical protein FDI24_gp047 [Acidovorax phage ACP17]|uniref:Uncharacterized protein n=1 Tax=Acidovorax phage ACP17 TaxID=2010329 RepID=A0A218M3F1_9CAUD|nr:hypothetical protein FDI24_gp047 [Acidovorax phage ACP17]ASD50580.1 hypothetical protein [Acidovorax phage ACP17]
MKTRKATQSELQAYQAMVGSSTAWADVMKFARAINLACKAQTGVSKELAAAHEAACAKWNEELRAAGFVTSITGLRVIK